MNAIINRPQFDISVLKVGSAVMIRNTNSTKLDAIFQPDCNLDNIFLIPSKKVQSNLPRVSFGIIKHSSPLKLVMVCILSNGTPVDVVVNIDTVVNGLLSIHLLKPEDGSDINEIPIG